MSRRTESFLETQNPRAAEIFKRYLPDWSEEMKDVIFTCDCCKMVDVT